MSFFNNEVIRAVEEVADIRYINYQTCDMWNRNRRNKDELRLLTGWRWVARDGSGRTQQGLKTISAAYRDAYYQLVLRRSVPTIGLTRLRRTG